MLGISCYVLEVEKCEKKFEAKQWFDPQDGVVDPLSRIATTFSALLPDTTQVQSAL